MRSNWPSSGWRSSVHWSQSFETVELSAVEWEPHVEIGAVTTNSKFNSVGIDSGAEIAVWPPKIAPETPAEESDESRPRCKILRPRGQERSDTRQPRSVGGMLSRSADKSEF